MDNSNTPLKVFSRIEAQVNSLVNQMEFDKADLPVRKSVEAIRRNLELIRKLLRDYESEEDVRTQMKLLPQSIEQLGVLRGRIVEASQHDIFGAADVAQLSAQIEQLIERLQ